jgi:photosystem II stability/assembly factor-like uncharacterized protein
VRTFRSALAPLLGLALALGGAGRATAALDFRPAPLYGADVRSLVFDPAVSERAFAGTSAGHLYRSDDGGESWRNAGVEAPFPGWVVAALRFDPNRPGRLWAALWGIWGGGLVAFTDDLGATWTSRGAGLEAGDQVYALALVPGIADRLFVGTRTGVWESDDAGVRFHLVSGAAPELVHVSSLHVDTLEPNRIVAGTWRRAYRSDDGGTTWRGVFEGMVLDTEVFSLTSVPGRPGELWASTCGWVYRGDRLGGRWSRTKTGFEERRTPSFDVLSPERLLAGTVAGLHLSIDGGASFRRVGPKDLAVLALAHHPLRPERVLIGTEGAGIWLSEDGGQTLAPRLVATVNVRVSALAAAGEAVLAALAHAGPLSGLYRSPDGGASFEPLPARIPTVLDLAGHGGRAWAATEAGLYERAGREWRRVAELGDARVEQLATGSERLYARTREAIWELAGTRFVKVPFAWRPPRSIAVAEGVLWVLRDEGLFRLGAGGQPEAASLPFPGGELRGVGGELVYAGVEGLYLHDREQGWIELSRRPSRAFPTGDPRYPAVARSGEGLALLAAGERRLITLAPPFAASHLLSALAVDGRLLLGSSGFGLWQASLPDGPAPPQAPSSEARIRR